MLLVVYCCVLCVCVYVHVYKLLGVMSAYVTAHTLAQYSSAQISDFVRFRFYVAVLWPAGSTFDFESLLVGKSFLAGHFCCYVNYEVHVYVNYGELLMHARLAPMVHCSLKFFCH